jgi:hypothetical protein
MQVRAPALSGAFALERRLRTLKAVLTRRASALPLRLDAGSHPPDDFG